MYVCKLNHYTMRKFIYFFVLLTLFSCSAKKEKSKDYPIKLIGVKAEIANIKLDGKDLQSVSYKTKDGEITWMTSNLLNTKFRNGDNLLLAQNIEEWVNASAKKIPVCCYWKFDPKNSDRGLYYNYYAVADKRNIAPDGWHIATNDDWIVLWDEVVPKSKEYDSGSFGPIRFEDGASAGCDENNWATFINYKDKNDWKKKSGDAMWAYEDFNKSKLNLSKNGFIIRKDGLYQVDRNDIKSLGMSTYLDGIFKNDFTSYESSGYFWTEDKMPSSYRGMARAISFDDSNLISVCYDMLQGFNIRCVRDK
jgi:uncharacterized protein (TIGR02145 family)